MQFNSYSYLLCLVAAVAGFWGLPERFRRPYVVILSLSFYASWNIAFIALPLTVCGIAYASAWCMLQYPTRRRRWVYCGVGSVIVLLAFFKYRGFFLETVGAWIPGIRGVSRSLPEIALPLGISFYSFEAISYLLDTRQGRVKRINFMDLTLFVTFWPHLIAGPIVRVRELAPQLKFDQPFQRAFLIRGLDRLIWGLVQKNLIANSLGSWVDAGFQAKIAVLNSTLDNWFLAVAFGLQIYFDFSAYSNMAIGAAQMIGVQLPENFRFPYHAWNPSDFWSRWHMTLSRWIRDYLFFPLNAKYKGARLPLYASTLGVMALVGLWHGAGWGYVLWGVMHGALLVAYRIFESMQPEEHAPAQTRLLTRWAWRAITIATVAAAWIPFRAGTLTQAGTMLSRMFLHPSFGLSYSVNFYIVTLMICAFCAFEPVLARAIDRWDAFVQQKRVYWITDAHLVRPLIFAVGILLFVIFDDQDTQFIYFQF